MASVREKVQKEIRDLASRHKVSLGDLQKDFCYFAPAYKKTSNRSGEVYPHLLKSAQLLEELLINQTLTDERYEELLRDGLQVLDVLDRANLKVKAKPIDPNKLIHPHLFSEARMILRPHVRLLLDVDAMLSTLFTLFLQSAKRVLGKRDLLGPNQILTKMHEAVKLKDFQRLVQENVKVAIIDEFQDTDPVQWDIFETLFLNPKSEWKGFLYLVGDPKQSIYAFRNADVYTYLKAKDLLGHEHCATLNTNYRSQKPLVNALNTLMAGDWIPLPKSNQTLLCQEVDAGKGTLHTFSDSLSALHFMLIQGEAGREKNWPPSSLESNVIDAIAGEVIDLSKTEGFKLSQFAILVRDRYQAQRVKDGLGKKGIPTLSRRQKTLLESPALHSLGEMIHAALNVRNPGALAQALGGMIIGWNASQILHFVEADESDQLAEQVLHHFYQLRQKLVGFGLPSFFQHLLTTKWNDTKMVEQGILSKKGGEQLYNELVSLVSLLSEYESSHQATPQELLELLGNRQLMKQLFQEKLEIAPDRSNDAVEIMTMHMSKGLEFDVVFALGLINRTPKPDGLLLCDKGGKRALYPSSSLNDPEMEAYVAEVDAEKMRQFYVTMTRAKLRLYCPIVIDEKQKPIHPGTASPMELFIALKQEGGSLKLEEIHDAIDSFVNNYLPALPNEVSISSSWIRDTDSQEAVSYEVKDSTLDLLPPKRHELPRWRSLIQSFSSLKRLRDGKAEMGNQVESEALSNAVMESTPNHRYHELPYGSEFGFVIHKIFQELDFQHFREPGPHHNLFDPYFQRNGCAYDWREWRTDIEELVTDVLTTPLFGVGHPFALCEVDPGKVLKEMEFLYPNVKQLDIAHQNKQTNYLKGYIDLVFEHRNQIYILDWKSNRLGLSEADYHPSKLQKVMDEHHYVLQGTIYAEAVRRYMQLFPGRSFDEGFGGIIYFFIRGVKSKQGVYTFTPTEAEMNAIEELRGEWVMH